MTDATTMSDYDVADLEATGLGRLLYEDKEWTHNEYVRLVPDIPADELRVYRLVGEAGSGEFVRATVKCSFPTVREVDRRGYDGRQRTPSAFGLHNDDAMTLVSLLQNYERDSYPQGLVLSWYGDDGMPMTDDTPTTVERLRIGYGGSASRLDVSVCITSAWQNEQHMLASF